MKLICKHISIIMIGLIHIPLYAPLEPAPNMTQSQAHVSVPQLHNLTQQWYSFDKNPYFEQLYDEVLKKERECVDSHYVFYNAYSNEWRVPQDLYLKLYVMLHPLTVSLENFRAFRWITVDHITPEEFIQKEMEEHGLINDNEFRVKMYLLSTNVALFGNVGHPGECTFEYYLNAKSNTNVSAAIFKCILDVFDAPTAYGPNQEPLLYKYIPEIMALDQYLKPEPLADGKEPQSLAQIFIPKEIADKVAYLSWVQGNPYDEQLANWVMVNAQTLPTSTPLYPPTQAFLDEIRQLFKDQQKEHPLFAKILSGIEQGRYKISTFLDMYKKTPEFIPGLNAMQARLIVSPEYIGNPAANVKVFMYDCISAERKAEYERILDDLVQRIFADIVALAQIRKLESSSAAEPNSPLR